MGGFNDNKSNISDVKSNYSLSRTRLRSNSLRSKLAFRNRAMKKKSSMTVLNVVLSPRNKSSRRRNKETIIAQSIMEEEELLHDQTIQ